MQREAVIQPHFYWLENFLRFQVQGSITLLIVQDVTNWRTNSAAKIGIIQIKMRFFQKKV